MAYYYSPFRQMYAKESEDSPCVFCDRENCIPKMVCRSDGKIVENDHCVWMINWYPKFEGHTMVVPKRHITDLGEETPEEVIAREKLISYAAKALTGLYPGAGIEVFLQTGSGSASSIAHLHWHVVPAQRDDPLRSFDKLGHFYTIEPDKEKVLVFPIEIKRAREDLKRALADLL